jgi:hypothetical protein
LSLPNLSAKVISELPAFKSAVFGTRNGVASEVLLKGVVTETYSIGNLTHSKVQRARDIVRNATEQSNFESYGQLATLCQQIENSNPGSRIPKDAFIGYLFFYLAP